MIPLPCGAAPQQLGVGEREADPVDAEQRAGDRDRRGAPLATRDHDQERDRQRRHRDLEHRRAAAVAGGDHHHRKRREADRRAGRQRASIRYSSFMQTAPIAIISSAHASPPRSTKTIAMIAAGTATSTRARDPSAAGARRCSPAVRWPRRRHSRTSAAVAVGSDRGRGPDLARRAPRRAPAARLSRLRLPPLERAARHQRPPKRRRRAANSSRPARTPRVRSPATARRGTMNSEYADCQSR